MPKEAASPVQGTESIAALPREGDLAEKDTVPEVGDEGGSSSNLV